MSIVNNMQKSYTVYLLFVYLLNRIFYDYFPRYSYINVSQTLKLYIP